MRRSSLRNGVTFAGSVPRKPRLAQGPVSRPGTSPSKMRDPPISKLLSVGKSRPFSSAYRFHNISPVPRMTMAELHQLTLWSLLTYYFLRASLVNGNVLYTNLSLPGNCISDGRSCHSQMQLTRGPGVVRFERGLGVLFPLAGRYQVLVRGYSP